MAVRYDAADAGTVHHPILDRSARTADTGGTVRDKKDAVRDGEETTPLPEESEAADLGAEAA